MDKNIINAPEFSSSILPYLNYAENYGPSLEVLMNLFNANEKIITIYRRINYIPRFVKNAETGKSEWGVTDKAILNEIVKGLPEHKKEALLKSEELRSIVNLEPPIEEMSIYKDSLVFPEKANPELKRLAQQKHRELKKQYDKYLDRNSGQAQLIKKISGLMSLVRNNISHGEKTPMGPDMNFNHRNQSIINVFIPFLKNVFFELLFDYPKTRICLYGTLRTGQSNHEKLKEFIDGDPIIKEGTVEGMLHRENNLDYFENKIPGEKISVEILILENSRTLIEKLKRFEGPDYKLNSVVAELEGKKILTSIFARNTNQW